jgi:two-component system, cell cycle response regulator
MAPPIDTARLDELKASGDLPSPKGVALAIMRLATQEDASMAEMARIIRTDPAFVGRLIKAANGVIGYGRRPIASVQDALTVLGMPAVRTMALGFSLMTHFRAGPCKAFNYQKYWSGCLVNAVATQAVTLRTRAAAPDEIYCLGLLSRVGELALATLYPVEYGEILTAAASTPNYDICEAEAKRFGMDHAELGAAMLADWGMPRVFTEAAFVSARGAECSFVEGSRERTVTETVMFAHAVSELCLVEGNERASHMRRVLMLGSRLDFDEATTRELCNAIARDWVDWGALLSIEAQRMQPFEAINVDEVPAEVEAQASAAVPVAASVQGAASRGAQVEVPQIVQVSIRSDDRTDSRPDAGAHHLSALTAMPDPLARAAMRQLLVNSGYEVSEASDIALAVEHALDHEPDIMIVDWSMAGNATKDYLSTLRKTRAGQGIFIIVVADSPDDEFRVRAFEFGADDVLAKPASPRLLLARLHAGRRLSTLQREIERDREEIRHYAAELAVSNRRLQEVAMMDPLTGFPNRRFFSDRLQQEWAASTRSKRSLSCLMVNLDGFRLVNESHGHEVGDSALRQVAASLRSVLRAHDVVARTGGDEFLILCPDTPLEAAQACADRLRVAVEAADLVAGMLQIKLTVSVGVACRDSSVPDAEALVRRAEQGLQIAKQNGRNRVSSMQLRPQASLGA